MNFAMPKTREELARALRENNGALLCAGGTDLMIRLREKKQFHYSLIDLTHMAEMAGIKETETSVIIGAAVTMDELERSSLIRRYLPALSKAASMVGSTQIRNRATIGGNVANASQSSDLTPVILAYDTRAAVCDRTGGIRMLAVDEFVKGLGRTELGETDVILWFEVEKTAAFSGFAKVGSRKAVAISKINVCVKADIEDGILRNVSVFLGAVGPKARRSPFIELALEGMELSRRDERVLKEAVYAQIEDNIPDRSSKHYKKPAAYGIICDALEEIKSRKEGSAVSELEYVGKRYVREDAYDKARGKNRYTCDRKLTGMLFAKLVLSEKAHASVRIRKEKALSVPGIRAVFTFEDVPAKAYNPHNWSACIDSPEDQYILSDKARYVGDHLALVVGESKAAVEEAVSLVEITYGEEAPVIGLSSARETENALAFEKEVSFGEYDKAEREAAVIVTTSGSTQKIHHGALESHIALADIDENGNLVLWTPCQTVYQVRFHISSLLGLPYTKIRVIKAVMGGSFGGKGQTVVEPACAFACWKLKQPVMLYMDRADSVIGTRSRNACEMKVETALTREGKILGRRIAADIDGGAYYTNAAAVAMAMAKKLFRMYHMEAQTCHVRTFFTNTIPGGACRGYGSPQAHAITEVNLDLAARELSMDPCELRLKNAAQPMDPDPTGGMNLGNARIEDCIRTGMEAFNWKERRAKVREKNTDRYAWGVGMACGAHGNGYKGSYPEFTNVQMMMHPDGSVEVRIGIHDQGCGTVLTMQQIAAEALHMDVYKIKVYEADTYITPYDAAGTQASRVTYVCGRAVQKAGEALFEKLIRAAGVLYGWDREEVRAADGQLCCRGGSKSYGEVAKEYEKACSRYLRAELEYEPPSNPGSYSSAFAEVKVDKYTGLVEVTDLLAVHDVGQCMNRTLAEGQVEGGAQMSLGMALCEEMVYDKKGAIKGRNFSKYHMINAPDMPPVKSIFIEKGEPDGPYGGKSIGELAAVAPGPAVVNAINFALEGRFSDYPVTPEKIIAFLEKERER